jgi:hypothetical protein
VVALAVEGSQRHAASGEHGQDMAGGVRVGAGLVDHRAGFRLRALQVVGSRVAVACGLV